MNSLRLHLRRGRAKFEVGDNTFDGIVELDDLAVTAGATSKREKNSLRDCLSFSDA